MKTYTFHITGTHCVSCKILIEDIVSDQDFVTSITVDLKKQTATISTEKEFEEEKLISLLNEKLQKNKYVLSIEQQKVKQGNSETTGSVMHKAIPIGIVVLIVFFLLQKSGILDIGFGEAVTPATSFVIGLVASVSSCLAIVGGLVLSLSAKVSQDNVPDTKNFVLFHVGRLVSFAVLGGVLGAVGGVIGINMTLTAILGLLASTIMILLGLNLVGVISNRYFTLHSGIFSFFKKVEHKTLTPLAIGFATFFLPCGFTQSMQLVALSSGSFGSGLLIMLAFALGTLPVLSLLSFGSGSFAHSKHAPLFFKSAGVVVIGFGLFALVSGFVGMGIIKPLSHYKQVASTQFQNPNEPGDSKESEKTSSNVEEKDGIQYVTITVGDGYSPENSVAKSGIQTKLIMKTTGTFDCSSSLVINSLGYKQVLPQTGETEIDLGTKRVGEAVDGTCGMGMYSFSIKFN